MTKSIFITAIAAAIIAAAAPAFAAPISETNSITVSAAGLDLNSSTGARTMLVMLHSASMRLCGAAPAIVDLNGTANWNACVSETLTRAVAQVNAPLVTVAFKGDKAQAFAAN